MGLDTEDGRARIVADGAKRVSILALDQQIGDQTDLKKVAYRGPFYIDIDNSDLAQSIDSARELWHKLSSFGVTERHLEIYCSGTKGFHFYLHSHLFYSGRAVAGLPQIYKQIAKELYVYGLDYQVYCGGRGNLFRLPGQREDGKFKVRVFPEDLSTMDEERYRYLTTVKPTNLAQMPMQAPTEPNPYCAALFQKSLALLKVEEKEARQPAVSESALAQFQQQPPSCIEDVCEGKIKPGVSYNQAAMQVAIFAVRAAVPYPIRSSLAHRLAKSLESSSYNTSAERIRHSEGLAKYMEHTPRMKFSCLAMRGIAATKPCETCPLAGTGEDPGEEEGYEIVERHNGYHHLGSQGSTKRITSFLLLPFQIIYSCPTGQDDPYKNREYILAHVEKNGVRHPTPVMLHEDCWTSRQKFLSPLSGISNLACFGNDTDIQRLKHKILSDLDEIDQQIGVNSVGVQRNKFKGKPQYTWVEQGFSVNKWGMRDTHIYTEAADTYEQSALPCLLDTKPINKEKHDYDGLMRNLFAINEPAVMSALMGWLSAAILRTHFMGLWSQFPLFMLWGGRGSGKTRTAQVLGALHGCDYLTHAPPTMASGTTDFALFNVCSSTTSVLRVLDEYNKHGMRTGRYEQVSEILKAAFNGSSISKGRLRRGREQASKGGGVVEHHAITAPLLILGEHAAEVPALIDRMYLVQLKEPSIAGRQKHMAHLLEHRDRLHEVGKAMVMQALHTRDDWLEERMGHWAGVFSPKGYNERQGYTRQVIGCGLDFLQHTLVEVLGLDLESELNQMRTVFAESQKGPRSISDQTGYLTEIDRLFSQVGTLLSAMKTGATNIMISSNIAWVDGDYFYYDPQMLFYQLEQHYLASRKILPVRSAEQFKNLAMAEPYFLCEIMMPNIVANRPCIRLSLPKMAERGIDITLFT